MLIWFCFPRTADGEVSAQTRERGSESAQQHQLVKESHEMPRNSTKDAEQEDDDEEEEEIMEDSEAPQNLSKKRGIVASVARPALSRIRRRKIRSRHKAVVAAGSQKPVQQEQQVGLKKYCARIFEIFLEKNWLQFGKNWFLLELSRKYVCRRIFVNFL